MRLHSLLLVPILTTAALTVVACEQEKGATHSGGTIWTYTITAEWADGKKGEINARYEYGNRAARMSSATGKLKTTVKTDGPKNVSINAGKGTDRQVKCKIVAKTSDRTRTVENSGKGTAVCAFKP